VAVSKRLRELTDEVGYHDLMADLKKPGCPICHGAQRAAWKYLDGLLWEFVNDPGVRAGLRLTPKENGIAATTSPFQTTHFELNPSLSGRYERLRQKLSDALP
jgi:hypothetical protein